MISATGEFAAPRCPAAQHACFVCRAWALMAGRGRYQKEHLLLQQAHMEECGLPRTFGLFYSIGVAIIFEGIFSASYHVCPSAIGFQFGALIGIRPAGARRDGS